MTKSFSTAATRGRRGSVLILVVVVVVLLALLGTAMLSSSRGDRATAQQNTSNTQVNILADSVKAMAQDAINRSLEGAYPYVKNVTTGVLDPTPQFQPPLYTSSSTAKDYQPYDAPNLNFDATLHEATLANPYRLGHDWLSPRAPIVSLNGGSYRAAWASISKYLVGDSFESPIIWASGAANDPYLGAVDKKFAEFQSTALNDNFFEPCSHFLTSTGTYLPAFRRKISGIATPFYFLAGDADGDGIADSGLFRLPVGQIDGVDYFAAVKIIDANSAVNLNTAWSRSGDYAAGAQAAQNNLVDATNNLSGVPLTDFAGNMGWFGTHVGLQEMLNRSDTIPRNPISTPYALTGNWAGEVNASTEMLALNRFRFGYPITQTNSLYADADIYKDTAVKNPSNPNSGTFSPSGAVVGATFLTQGDALDHQLGNRLRNPGIVHLPGGGIGTFNCGSLVIGNTTALAYHGGLMINPDGEKSPVESIFASARSLNSSIPANLPDSIYSSAANFPGNANIPKGLANGRSGYSADQTWRWILDFYNTDSEAGARNVFDTSLRPDGTERGAVASYYPNTTNAFPSYASARPFVTTWSPTSNLVPQVRTVSQTTTAAPATSPADLLPATLPVFNDGNNTQVSPYANTFPSSSAPYTKNQAKVSVNTASFNELWLAYFNVMADKHEVDAAAAPPVDTATPFDGSGGTVKSYSDQTDIYVGQQYATTKPAAGALSPPYYQASATADPERMFRSSLRDTRVGSAPFYFPQTSQMQLRAALAAVQTLQLRSESLAGNKSATVLPLYKDITLPASNAGVVAPYKVRVFGTQPQPFITEFYAQTDQVYIPPGAPGANYIGYVAIELYNPFDQAITLDNTYELVTVPRSAASAYPLMTDPVIYTFANTVIQPHGYVLIENYNDPASANPPQNAANYAQYRPASSMGAGHSIPVTGSITTSNSANGVNAVLTADLSQLSAKEVVLRRKVVAAPTVPIDYYAIDSLNLSSVVLVNDAVNQAAGSPAFEYHYVRPSGTANNNNWRCVYPGRYDGQQTKQQGFDSDQFNPSAGMDNDNWIGTTPVRPPSAAINLGGADATPSWSNDAAQTTGSFTIPLSGGVDSPGPALNAGNSFPFGSFAREGDILKVLYIGAYTVQDSGAAPGLYEMNSISMDSAFAEDTDLTDDEVYANGTMASVKQASAGYTNAPIATESIGRFCPVIDPDVSRNDLDPAGRYDLTMATATLPGWNYRWATKLFDYLTVTAPQEDFVPAVPVTATGGGALSTTGVNAAFGALQPVDNKGTGVGNGTYSTGSAPFASFEDTEPRQGLININTAPWQVLAALPMLQTGHHHDLNVTTAAWTGPTGAAGQQTDDNVKLAQAIALWRDGDPANGVAPNGPFHNLFELYRVPAFASANALVMDAAMAPHGPDYTVGDFSVNTINAARDYVRFDYDEQYLLLNKISNLITTRSDSYIVYIEIQGWRDLGTSKPTLAVRNHVAFIQDRWKRTYTDPINPPVNFNNE